MKKTHALTDYSKYKDDELVTEGSTVVSMSTNNPNAANADPTVAEVELATKSFKDANIAAKSGDHVKVVVKGKAKVKLQETLHDFAESIDEIADGDVEIIKSCGLHPTDEPSHAEHDELELEHGEAPNQIIARCKKVDLAGAYALQIFYGLNPPADEELWKIKTVSLQIEAVLAGLTKGDLCVRYCAVTKDGMQPWSQHRHIFVL